MSNLNYNLSTIYPNINKEKFGGECMIRIDSGCIYNNNLIYLDLSDLNMLEDLGNILDFYRNLNKEGNIYRIKLLGNSQIHNNSQPVIEKFNLYEWIPIKGYLENRNINSHLFRRKLMICCLEDAIHLKLLDPNIDTDRYTYDSVKLLDKIYRIFSLFNVPSTLEKTIIDASMNIKSKYHTSRRLMDMIILI